jgi:hypothetical protein
MMQRLDHSPAYVAQVGRAWRIVVPIKGKLSPRVCANEFPTQISAVIWLQSDEGQQEVAIKRASRSAARSLAATAAREGRPA